VRLGRRLAGGTWGLPAGLLAGGVLALSPLLYAESRLIAPDILLTMLAALAIARLVDIVETGRRRDYLWAAVWIGLGASAKYSPLLLAPALYVAHLLRRRREGRAAGPGLGDRRLWWAAVACIAAFAVTSPYLILDLAVLQRDVADQFIHLGGGHLGHEARGGISFYYLRDVLAPALGWPGLLVGVAGLGWAAWRRRGAWLAVTVSLLCLYLGLGFLSTQFDRYMLPLLLPVALGTAAAMAWLDGRLAARPRAVRLAAAGLLAAVVLVPPAVRTLEVARSQAQPSTLQLARQFLVAEFEDPQDLVVAMEVLTPELPESWQVLYLPLSTVRVEVTDFYYDLRHFLPVDLVVTSGAVKGRYLQAPDRFPRQVAFYRDLERYTQRVREFRPDRHTRGPTITIDRWTAAGRERLLRERGALEPGFYRPFLPNLHATHFHPFLAGIAWHAYQKQMDAHADLYYQALAETAPAGGERVFQSPHVMARLRLGRLDAAQQMCEEALLRDPRHTQALTLLGLVHETRGDRDQAIAIYERCIAIGEADRAAGIAPDPRAFFDGPAQARRQLAALRANRPQ
jgi:hypothetical protein